MDSNCIQCGLYAFSDHPKIMGRGTFHPKIILIGEAPGPDEAKQGKPFVGRAGKKLDKMIKKFGDIFYITNMVKCFPPVSYVHPEKGFRVPKESEINYCNAFLMDEILNLSKVTNPILMPLGNVALKGLIPNSEGITKELGKIHNVIINSFNNCYTLIPNYHPSYILRNHSKETDFISVMEKAYEYCFK